MKRKNAYGDRKLSFRKAHCADSLSQDISTLFYSSDGFPDTISSDKNDSYLPRSYHLHTMRRLPRDRSKLQILISTSGFVTQEALWVDASLNRIRANVFFFVINRIFFHMVQGEAEEYYEVSNLSRSVVFAQCSYANVA